MARRVVQCSLGPSFYGPAADRRKDDTKRKRPEMTDFEEKDSKQKEDKRIYTMSAEKPAKAVVRMGVPLIAGMFVMVLYNLVDTFFIGLLRDDYQLAAVNLAYPVMMVTIAVSNMVGTGASTLIARSMGAGETEKARRALTTGMVLTVITAVIITAAGLVLLGPIVHGLGAKENTFLYTSQYVRILLIGTVFTMGNYTFGALLRGEGSAGASILGMAAGTVINIVLDPVFIFALGLEVRGAAIATVLGNACGMGLTLMIYAGGRAVLSPRSCYLAPQKDTVSEIYRIGVPAALETLLTSAAFVVNNNLAVAYGELTIAAMGISQKLLTLGNYIYQGFAAGVQPVMGYCYGAKDHGRMLDVLKAGIMIVFGTEMAVMLIYGIFAPHLIALFTGSNAVIRTGSKVLRAMIFVLPCAGVTSMSRMSLQAMGKPVHALGITIMRQLVMYIPLLFLMDHLAGFSGLIWAQPLTDAVMMILSVKLLVKTIRREQSEDVGDE